ncbi:MAG: hypothetical protein U0930_04850 [Pirellulales bacterium]
MKDNRATNIAIGTVVIAILTWWLITGTVSRAVSIPLESDDNRLSSVGSFGVEILADLAYLVGVVTTSMLSGLWTLLRALFSKLIELANKPNSNSTSDNPVVDVETLKAGLLQVRNPIREELEKIKQRLLDLESGKSSEVPANATKSASRPRRAKASPKKPAGASSNDPA